MQSSVATPPSPPDSGTALTVATGEGALFPPPPFSCVVMPEQDDPTPQNSEAILVSTLAGDNFSLIQRAQQGSSARTILAGDRIELGALEQQAPGPSEIYPGAPVDDIADHYLVQPADGAIRVDVMALTEVINIYLPAASAAIRSLWVLAYGNNPPQGVQVVPASGDSISLVTDGAILVDDAKVLLASDGFSDWTLLIG